MSLTTEQKTILNDEITNDPLGKGYASHLPDRTGHVVDLLNATTETKVKSRMITARGILSDYPGRPFAAAAAMDKLDAAAPNISPLKWAWKFINSEGLDIGNAATQGMLDTLASEAGGNVITAQEAANLKALALYPASRAEVLGLPHMTTELFLSRDQ